MNTPHSTRRANTVASERSRRSKRHLSGSEAQDDNVHNKKRLLDIVNKGETPRNLRRAKSTSKSPKEKCRIPVLSKTPKSKAKQKINNITVTVDTFQTETPTTPELIKSDEQKEDHEHSATKKISPQRRVSGGNRRKSKRRSSFVRGRISKVVSPSNHLDVLDIPLDLSPEERLARLSSGIVKFALNRLDVELQDLDGIQQFKVEAMDAVDSAVGKFHSNKMFLKATSKERFLSNPANEMMAKTIEELSTYTERLKKEIEQWQEILQDNQNKAKLAQRIASDVGSQQITEKPVKGFSPQELTSLLERPNYNGLLDCLYTHQEKTCLAVNKLIQITNVLQEFHQTVNAIQNHEVARIYQETFSRMEHFHSPDRLISSVLEFKD